MNAIIIDICENQAAVLDKNGCIRRIHNAGYAIGQAVELHDRGTTRRINIQRFITSGIAAAAMIAVIGSGVAYALPYGTVAMEGNPSVEYTINCFNYVLDIRMTDTEDDDLLGKIDLHQIRHHYVKNAVLATMDQFERIGFEENPENTIRLSVETQNKRHTELLQQELGPIAGQVGAVTDSEADETPDNSSHAVAVFNSDCPSEEVAKSEHIDTGLQNQDCDSFLPDDDSQNKLKSGDDLNSIGVPECGSNNNPEQPEASASFAVSSSKDVRQEYADNQPQDSDMDPPALEESAYGQKLSDAHNDTSNQAQEASDNVPAHTGISSDLSTPFDPAPEIPDSDPVPEIPESDPGLKNQDDTLPQTDSGSEIPVSDKSLQDATLSGDYNSNASPKPEERGDVALQKEDLPDPAALSDEEAFSTPDNHKSCPVP